MKPENLKAINQSFEIQADQFESETLQFTKQEYLDYTVESVKPCGEEAMLEAAAGTCICGRAFAPYVRTVVCLDATDAMPEVGRREAENSGLKNMVFVRGYAEELPFLNKSFDIVFSRLAFHHFTDTEKCFSEMARCLRTGGRLVMIDMEAAREDILRKMEEDLNSGEKTGFYPYVMDGKICFDQRWVLTIGIKL